MEKDTRLCCSLPARAAYGRKQKRLHRAVCFPAGDQGKAKSSSGAVSVLMRVKACASQLSLIGGSFGEKTANVFPFKPTNLIFPCWFNGHEHEGNGNSALCSVSLCLKNPCAWSSWQSSRAAPHTAQEYGPHNSADSTNTVWFKHFPWPLPFLAPLRLKWSHNLSACLVC